MIDLAAVAAFTAAALSAVGVIVTVQAQDRSDRYNWRRESLPELMQRMLLWNSNPRRSDPSSAPSTHLSVNLAGGTPPQSSSVRPNAGRLAPRLAARTKPC